MLEYDFHPEASDEFEQIVRHYLWEADIDIATRFRNEFFSTLQKCRKSPLLYRTFHKNVRRIIFQPPFGEYYLPFVVLDEKIYILAVAHAKRKPLYWRKRIKDTN